jgi:multidrug efflux pump subunit AcrB
MSPSGLWLPVILAAQIMVCQCHRGMTSGASPHTPRSLTVLLRGTPDSQALCRAAEVVEKSLAAEAYVKSMHVSGYAEDELVIEADPDQMDKVGMDMTVLAAALRQGLPAVPEEDMAVDKEKQSVAITLRECKKLDLDADQIRSVLVKDPMGNYIPLGYLAVLKVHVKSRGFFHKGKRALKVEIALADAAEYEEAKKSLEGALAEQLDAALFHWEVQ